jgi:hypothetical protein
MKRRHAGGCGLSCKRPTTAGTSTSGSRELGPEYFDQLEPERRTRQLVRQLESLGHKVTLEPKVVA